MRGERRRPIYYSTTFPRKYEEPEGDGLVGDSQIRKCGSGSSVCSAKSCKIEENSRGPDSRYLRLFGPETAVHGARQSRTTGGTVARSRIVTFVRSTNDNFLSLVVPMVDEGKLERDQKLASKAKWMTSRGFVYPAAGAGDLESPPQKRVCIASGRTPGGVGRGRIVSGS